MAAQRDHRLTFVIGGARSGKSAFAEGLICARPGPWHYVATAQAYDDEMAARICEHRSRRGAGWITHEAGADLAGVLRRLPDGEPVLVDCLTLWLTGVMLAEREPVGGAVDQLVLAVKAHAGPLVVVSTEVGLGIVPENALARAFRDQAGRLHQRVAAEADRVVLVVAGLPMEVK